MSFEFNMYSIPTEQSLQDKTTGDTSQNINIVDVVCEGPVHGLVGGAAGVFLNDVSSEYAEFVEFIPNQGPEGSDSSLGTIEFDGGNDLTGDIDSNTTLPEDLEISGEVPRLLVIGNYYEQKVTVSTTDNSNNESGLGYFVTLTATGANPQTFTEDWVVVPGISQTAAIYREGQKIAGALYFSTSTTFAFQIPSGQKPEIDYNATYTLKVTKSFNITSIDKTSTPQTITVDEAPNAGTYNFAIGKQPTQEELAAFVEDRFGRDINKIDNIQIQFNPGDLEQAPLTPSDGVGGSTSIPGDIRKINLPELKFISASGVPSGLTRFDPTGMPSGSTDFNEDPTVISSTAFGLTSSAQIQEVDQISWTIRYPSFQILDLGNGAKETCYAFYSMNIAFYNNGAWGDYVNVFPNYGDYITHLGNTNAPTQFEHLVDLEQFRPFEDFRVRIVRLTRQVGLPIRADGTSAGRTDQDNWNVSAAASIASLNSIITDRFNYPYTAHTSVTFSSRQFSSVPKRSYLLKGLLVKIPDNYTPREYSDQFDSNGNPKAIYDGFWGGDFATVPYYTDNPAWVFYDILTNNRYGAGRWIQEFDIDKYSLYRVAKYCDELVPSGRKDSNGNIIYEPRFRSNIFLTKSTDIYKVLKDMATTFLGLLYWQDGKLTTVQDSPQDPIYTFSKSNVIDGKFNYESTGSRTRVNQVVVTWNDPTINYEPVPLVVEDRESIVRTGRIISQNSVAFGATSEGQALRYGRWKLWTAQNQTEIISFKTSLEAQFVKAGDVINVQDADKYGLKYSGRVSSATSTGLTLDRQVQFNSSYDYSVSVLITEPAAFWSGSTGKIRINNLDIYPGDRIPEAYVEINGTGTLVALDSQERYGLSGEQRATSAFLDEDLTTPLSLLWKEHSYVQTEDIVAPGNTLTNTITLDNSETFNTTPSVSTVWALSATQNGGNVLGSAKQYKILGIKQDSNNEYSITAVEFYNEKFIAVEEDYNLGQLPDSIYPEAEPEIVPPPTNLRIILDTNAVTPGEELFIEWDAPNFDYISEYEIRHNIPGIVNPIKSANTKVLLTTIPNGLLNVGVRVVSAKGNYSRYETLSYTVDDPFNSNVTRVQEGIPKGIIASSSIVINADNELGFETDPTNAVSIAESLGNAKQITENDNIDISNLDSNENEYFVLLEGSTLSLIYYDTTSLDNFSYWRTIPASGNLNSSQSSNWTSVASNVAVSASSSTVTGTSTTFTTDVKVRDILVFGSATDFTPYSITNVSLTAGSAVQISFTAPSDNLFSNGDRIKIENVTGSSRLNNYFYINNVSSTFDAVDENYDYTLRLYSNPDISDSDNIFDPDTDGDNSVDISWTSGGTIKNSPPVASVISVVSDTELRLDRALPNAVISGTSVYRRTYRPSFTGDAVFAKVSYNGSSYSLSKYITLDPDLTAGRAIFADTNVDALQYEQNSDGNTTQINIPTNLQVIATAIGFKDPVFKVSSISSYFDGTVDTTFQNPDTVGGFVYTKTVNSTGAVDYRDGTPESVTIEAAERYATNNEISNEAFFSKLRDGATGLDGKTVVLSAEDYSIIYDSEGDNPSYNSTTAGTIKLTATDYNFTTPAYRFTQGGTLGDWGTNNEISYTVPSTFASWTNKTIVFKVEVAEQPSDFPTTLPSEASASDSISLVAVKSGAGGVALVNSNSSHSYPTENDGSISESTIVGSGTTLELLIGGIVGTYVGATSGVNAGVTPGTTVTLENKEWYIQSVDDSDGNLVAGDITDVSNNIVTIEDAAVSGALQDVESITWTIKYKSEGSEQTITTTQTLTKSKKGSDGIEGVSVTLSASETGVTYSYDGANWDPSSSSVAVTVETTGLTNLSYDWGTSPGTGTGATRTVSFSSVQAEANIPGNQTVSVDVQGNTSDGTALSSPITRSLTIPVSKAAAGITGLRSSTLLIFYTLGVSPETDGTYTPPDTPSTTGLVFNFNNFSITSGSLGSWSFNAPNFTTLNSNGDFYRWYAATMYVTEGRSGGVPTGDTSSGGSIEFGPARVTTGFTGLVTFSGKELIWDATGGSFNYTAIDGSGITTGTVSGPNLGFLNTNSLGSDNTNPVGAGNQAVSLGASTYTSSGMEIDFVNSRIHSTNFYVNPSASPVAGFKGTMEVQGDSTITNTLKVGTAANVKLDGPNQRIVINDGTYDRVILGKIS